MVTKFEKRKKISSWQNIFFSTLLGILVLVVIGFLVYQNFKINQRKTQLVSRIEELQREIQELEEKKELLESGISQAGMEEYIEKIAREELNLQKKGEKAVGFILPEEKTKEEETKESFWGKWWQWLKSKF